MPGATSRSSRSASIRATRRPTPPRPKPNIWRSIAIRDAAAGWHFLTGPQAVVERIAGTVGFAYRYDAAIDQYMHPVGFVVAAANGRISHYLLVIDPAPAELRAALADAAQAKCSRPADPLPIVVPWRRPAARPLHRADRGGVRRRQCGGDGGARRRLRHDPATASRLRQRCSWVPFWPRTAAISGQVVNAAVRRRTRPLRPDPACWCCGMMLVFCVRYRRGSSASRADPTRRAGSSRSAGPAATLVAFLGLFVWGADGLHLALPVAGRRSRNLSSSASSGCGRSSTRAASARSTRCTSRSTRRCGWC